jgi:two-component system, chemotaxis family, protein-glutamate methylesterase/glutaminase
MPDPVRVMVVDDSPLARKVLSEVLTAAGMLVTATAGSAELALAKVDGARPDVITMDIEMPGMGGLVGIEKMMTRRPTPIVVLSAFAQKGARLTMQALDRGAVDFIAKPGMGMQGGMAAFAAELAEKIRTASRIDVKRLARVDAVKEGHPAAAFAARLPPHPFEVVAIGASTGGPPALRCVLKGLPAAFPAGILVVQHMPPVFTKAFADRLNDECVIPVKEAEEGDRLLPGSAFIAPGDQHVSVWRDGGQPRLRLDRRPPVCGHRPSVDVMMASVEREFGARAVAVIMTGMGRDGSEGIRALKQRGAVVIAQDEESSVIFGMNREVIKAGNADAVVPLAGIAAALNDLAGTRTAA